MGFVAWFKHWSHQVLLGEDRECNAVLGGESAETISSRVGRAQLRGVWFAVYIAAPVINFIMRNPNHCIQAIGT